MRSVVRDLTAVELVEVRDPKGRGNHMVAVTVSENATEYFKDDGSRHWCSAKITVEARYVAGPALVGGGRHISTMGGTTGHENCVKLTNGGVTVDPQVQGLHIGSVLFGRIVAWAKQFPDDWRVTPISLSVVDARDADNKSRRNRLYEQFGLRFNYRTVDGIDYAEGSSDPSLTVGELVPRDRWEGVRVLGMLGPALGEVLHNAELHQRELQKAKRAAATFRRLWNRRERTRWFLARRINWIFVGVAAVAGFYVRKFLIG